jgi:hypothetical protein
MNDILRGIVTRIVDGDTFEMEVLETFSPDPDKYETVERVRVNSLSDDIEATEANEEGTMESDEEEMLGTPEEASIEAGSADTTRFPGVRDPEDLEAKVMGRTVSCTVLERTRAALLVADVAVL